MTEAEKLYDNYGVLKTIPHPIIEKGDRVCYIASKHEKVGDKVVLVKVKLTGYWDGEKVEFNDVDRHVVRAKRWLTKIE